eukprot:gene7449-4842_t
MPPGATWGSAGLPEYAEDAAIGYQNSAVSGGGSNCWVVGPGKSASGAALVAGDPHLALQVPGQWYV